MGEPDRAPRCSVSVYDPSHLAGQIMIRSMSLFGTFGTCRSTLKMTVYRGGPEVDVISQNGAFDPKATFAVKPSQDQGDGRGSRLA